MLADEKAPVGGTVVPPKARLHEKQIKGCLVSGLVNRGRGLMTLGAFQGGTGIWSQGLIW